MQPAAKQIEVRDLSVRYGEIAGVSNLNLVVGQGEIVALVGANGAGKSTTLKAIMGMVVPVRGAIIVNGENVTGQPAHTAARRGVALVPEGRRVFSRMTVRENLEVGGVTRPRSEAPTRMNDVFQLFPRLKARQPQLAGTLSGGEQQMLAIGRALMARPDFMLFDEPSLGLAPLLVETILAAIRRISRDFGIGGVLVEQNVNVALGLATRAYVLARGQLVLSGTSAELRGSPQLQQAYLGTLAGSPGR
ncbi:MAG: ABC transporter ATP-binding protein [Acidobacteriota bacterium]